jgi:hypothetical protein
VSVYGTLIAVGTLAALVLRVFYRYQVARMYSEHRAAQRATEQAYSRDNATLASLTQDAAQLETRGCSVVLAAVLSQPEYALDKGALETKCVDLLRMLERETGLGPCHLTMNVAKCVDVLQRFGVVGVDEEGRVKFCGTSAAIQSLEGVWKSLLTERR